MMSNYQSIQEFNWMGCNKFKGEKEYEKLVLEFIKMEPFCHIVHGEGDWKSNWNREMEIHRRNE